MGLLSEFSEVGFLENFYRRMPSNEDDPKQYFWNISQGVLEQNAWSITQVCSETKYVGIRSKVQAHVITNSSIFEWFQRTKIVVNPQDSTFYDDFLGGTLPEKFPFCFFGLRKKNLLVLLLHENAGCILNDREIRYIIGLH